MVRQNELWFNYFEIRKNNKNQFFYIEFLKKYTTDNYKNVILVKIFSVKKYCVFCAKRNITSGYI